MSFTIINAVMSHVVNDRKLAKLGKFVSKNIGKCLMKLLIQTTGLSMWLHG